MDAGSDDSSCLSQDSDVAFALMDFEGVNFDEEGEGDGAKMPETGKPSHPNVAAKEEKETPCDDDVDVPAQVVQKESQITSNSHVDANNALMKGAKALMEDAGGEGSESNAAKTIDSSEPSNIVFERIYAPPMDLDEDAKVAIDEECYILLKDCYVGDTDKPRQNKKLPLDCEVLKRIQESSKLLSQGRYLDILSGPTATIFFEYATSDPNESLSVAQRIRHCILQYCTTVAKCVEVELMGVAALNIFMQCNYTGPSLHHGGVSRPGKEEETYEILRTVNPHLVFASQLNVSRDGDIVELEKGEHENEKQDDKVKEPIFDAPYHNAVLGELSVDGEWPCPVCKLPYFLLVARSILSTLADPNRPDWTECIEERKEDEYNHKVVIRESARGNNFQPPSAALVSCAQNLTCAQLWCARAIVAHSRLLQGDEPSITLWKEAQSVFSACVAKFCESSDGETDGEKRTLASKVFLEYGLAEHHFNREKLGKPFFKKALAHSDLDVEVTGAEGKRTKYQQKATAQMLVRAKPKAVIKEQQEEEVVDSSKEKTRISQQEIQFERDTIMLNRVKYEEDGDNVHFQLNLLQQTVLLALCLDVKNDNPMDGLTAEQMGAYLERVLQQHDDWMVYATGLLERAWLESERNHTRERALFQLQALSDQHTNRLTFTQSTFQAAVEDSAPPQERLRNIHYIVYPPRWAAQRDLAERYAKLGIVTSAAEIFEEIELWDEVVECYRRAGKETKAEEVVRKRLSEAETPRMWAALGDITGDKSHYEKALKLSNGRYSSAYVALGKYYSDKGQIKEAVEQFKMAVQIKPLSPHIWFRIGALSMRLEDWETALLAFTEVVEQEPEEGDAWANVAAIHMHNKNPSEAYPALNEVRCILIPRYMFGVILMNILIQIPFCCYL